MRRPFKGRQTVRQHREAVNATDAYYAAAFGKAPAFQTALKPLRERSTDIDAVHKGRSKPLERVVLADVLKALRRHPKVAMVWRMQSGVFQEGSRFIKVGTRGMPDVIGMLFGGKLFAVEVKRSGRRAEHHQEKILGDIRAAGGIAGVATSAIEAVALVEANG